MLENLKPIFEEHSISRVIATIFIPQTFVKPQDIFTKVENISYFDTYPKKSFVSSKTINISNEGILNKSEEQIKGFIFESYNDKGSIKNIFKVENNKFDQSIISLDNREYENWDLYKKELDSVLDSFSSVNEFYVEGVSLNYRDEFKWTGKDAIPVKEIFNNDSELLNKKFLSSRNGSLVSISQSENHGSTFEEKIEISFSNNLKRIIIDHKYAQKFETINLFNTLKEEKSFSSYFDMAHEENKKTLKDILTKKIQDLIKLK